MTRITFKSKLYNKQQGFWSKTHFLKVDFLQFSLNGTELMGAYHKVLTHMFTILQDRQTTFSNIEFLLRKKWETALEIN